MSKSVTLTTNFLGPTEIACKRSPPSCLLFWATLGLQRSAGRGRIFNGDHVKITRIVRVHEVSPELGSACQLIMGKRRGNKPHPRGSKGGVFHRRRISGELDRVDPGILTRAEKQLVCPGYFKLLNSWHIWGTSVIASAPWAENWANDCDTMTASSLMSLTLTAVRPENAESGGLISEIYHRPVLGRKSSHPVSSTKGQQQSAETCLPRSINHGATAYSTSAPICSSVPWTSVHRNTRPKKEGDQPWPACNVVRGRYGATV